MLDSEYFAILFKWLKEFLPAQYNALKTLPKYTICGRRISSRDHFSPGMDVGCCYSFAKFCLQNCIYECEFVDPSEIQHNKCSDAVLLEHDLAIHLGKTAFDA